MKKLLNLTIVAVGLVQPTAAADLDLLVENITDHRGTLFWSVFDSEEDYRADARAVVAARSRVTGGTIRVTLHDLPPGEYAVKLFHDANDNGEMDSNMLGIPIEGYGFSNNAGRFGPASFEDARISVTSDTQIKIRLR
jgi:uncharacterized protein (DUF2141 family)